MGRTGYQFDYFAVDVKCISNQKSLLEIYISVFLVVCSRNYSILVLCINLLSENPGEPGQMVIL